MSNPDGTADLSGRMRAALDPLLPRAGADRRVLQRFRAQVLDAPRPRSRRLRVSRDGHLAAAGVALLVAALLGGTLVLALGMRVHLAPHQAQPKLPRVAAPSPVVTLPVKPYFPPQSPTPLVTPAAIDYVAPWRISFADARDGWALGSGCDMQQRCEQTVARTTDGGHSWQAVTPPVQPGEARSVSQIVAASAQDAWVWDPYANSGAVFRDTHDGGHTWHTLDTGSAVVTSVAVADGTVWAVTACASPGNSAAAPCSVRVLASPVHTDAWAPLGTPPAAVQRPAWRGLQVVRFGTRAWLLADDPEAIAGMVRSDDGGKTWVTLTVPCQRMNTLVLGASSLSHLLLACVSVGSWPAPQEVWSSHDGGAHWTLRSRYADFVGGPTPQRNVGSLHNEGAPIELAVINDTTAWMASERGTDMVTHDDGVTWTTGPLPDGPFGNAGGSEGITFADALHGWTLASAGMWATVDGGVHWTYQPVVGRVPGYQ